MANEIQIFSNPQFGEIRTAIGKNGEPMFCLADVCKAVGLTNASSVKTRLDKDDVQVFDLHALKLTEGGTGNTKANFITENAFYDVLLYSDAPQVKPFRKWVTSEVLPTIRKTGQYSVKPLTQGQMLVQMEQRQMEQERRQNVIENKVALIEDRIRDNGYMTVKGFANIVKIRIGKPMAKNSVGSRPNGVGR